MAAAGVTPWSTHAVSTASSVRASPASGSRPVRSRKADATNGCSRMRSDRRCPRMMVSSSCGVLTIFEMAVVK
ncbi:Uncharacterised protein [Bordetella pertussis]|nr:Uncharacterised protein [Bordetella pertussis]